MVLHARHIYHNLVHVSIISDIRKSDIRKPQRCQRTTISFINLKGGVAKTTTTVVVAEMLDSEFGKKS